ncbi:MAG: hypothetical protein KGI26_04000 [Thaumarchaeota archaeon]|nr:hypothetical protein [Nitrososphaerota archaeon]
MSLRVGLALGDRRSFAARVLALSALVALVAASFALRDLVSEAAPSSSGGGAQLLVSAFLSEVGSLIDAWLVPVWLLTAAGAFVVSVDSARSFRGTSALLGELGGEGAAAAAVLALRALLLSAVAFVLGLSLGVVASQVVFRALLVLLGAPYYVPALTPLSLAIAAALAFSAMLAGSGASALLDARRRSG